MKRISPFKTLDAFRGFAAVWVVMDHSCDRWIPDNHWAYLKVPLYAFSLQGQLGVTLFFLISGYCITAAAYGAMIWNKSIWQYAYERIKRIYPPYFAALLVTALSIELIHVANGYHWIANVNHLQTLQSNPRYWIANLLLIQRELNMPMINIVFWSLCYEIAFYFIIGIVLVGSKRIAKRQNLATGAAFFANAVGISTALVLMWMLVYHQPLFPLDMWHQFSIGSLLFFLLEWNRETVPGFTKNLRQMVIANLAVVVALTIAYAVLRQVGHPGVGHPSSGVSSITCLLFAALLIVIRPIDDKVSSNIILRPMMLIGGFSYSLYLTHPIVIPYVEILALRAGFNGSSYWIDFWMQVAASIFVGRIFYVVIETHFISKRQVKRLAAEHVG